MASPARPLAQFAVLFVFSIILYLRPYELFPCAVGFTPDGVLHRPRHARSSITSTQLALEGNLTARPKEINLVLLLGVAALLSMPLAGDPGGAWETFSDMLLKTILIFIVLVNVVRTELRLKLLLLLVLGVSIYLSINAINDYRAGVFAIGAAETHDLRIGGRIKGLFENSNDLAMHLVTMIPIAVALGLSGRNPLKKLIYFGVHGIDGWSGDCDILARRIYRPRGGDVCVGADGWGRRIAWRRCGALVFAVICSWPWRRALSPGRLATIFNSAADLTGSSSQRTEVLKRSIWVALAISVVRRWYRKLSFTSRLVIWKPTTPTRKSLPKWESRRWWSTSCF